MSFWQKSDDNGDDDVKGLGKTNSLSWIIRHLRLPQTYFYALPLVFLHEGVAMCRPT